VGRRCSLRAEQTNSRRPERNNASRLPSFN
jgi:hypothetical protein